MLVSYRDDLGESGPGQTTTTHCPPNKRDVYICFPLTSLDAGRAGGLRTSSSALDEVSLGVGGNRILVRTDIFLCTSSMGRFFVCNVYVVLHVCMYLLRHTHSNVNVKL